MATVTARTLPWYAPPRVAQAVRQVRRYPLIPLSLLMVFLVIPAVFAPLVSPYDPLRGSLAKRLKPPVWEQGGTIEHPLGTDKLGRDILSRMIHGARVSLGIGTLAMLIAVTVGAGVGAVAGYFQRWADAGLMRLVDVGLAMPRIFVLLIAVALWERVPLAVLVLLIGLTGWFGTSRLVRAEVLSVREREFVAAARALGAGPARVIFRHVLPNAAAPVIVSAALGIGNVMLLEAGLSFLGLGVPSPAPSWGSMIFDGSQLIAAAPWTASSFASREQNGIMRTTTRCLAYTRSRLHSAITGRISIFRAGRCSIGSECGTRSSASIDSAITC